MIDTNTSAVSPAKLAMEGRLLYTLLDAAENAGVIHDRIVQQRWEEIKRGFQSSSYEAGAESFFQLMSALYNSGALAGTWLAARWEALEKRVRSPGRARETNPPW